MIRQSETRAGREGDNQITKNDSESIIKVGPDMELKHQIRIPIRQNHIIVSKIPA
jgi:hypothetical protein